MSEHITHVAVFEDCHNMIKHSGDKLTKAFRESTEKAFDSGLFCSGSRRNHLFAVPILEKTRDIYKQGKADQQILEQISGAIGWLTHRATDLQMKPFFRTIEGKGVEMLIDDEAQMYQDAESFRHVFSGGKVKSKSPYSYFTEATLATGMKPHPATTHLNADAVENIFTHYILYEMLTTNVFIENEKDPEVLATKIIEQSQDLYEDLRIYIRAFQNPEPVKKAAFLTRPNFYDPNDEIIQFVRYAQQRGKAHPGITLEDALKNTTEDNSYYAQALKKCNDFLTAASNYFDGKIDKSTLYDSVEIFHEPHRI